MANEAIEQSTKQNIKIFSLSLAKYFYLADYIKTAAIRQIPSYLCLKPYFLATALALFLNVPY